MVRLDKKPYNLNEEQVTYVNDKIKKMTIKEKVGQIFFVIGQDENNVNLSDFIQKYQPGGMMYRPDTAEKIKRQINYIQSKSRIPLFFAANLESGGNGIINEGTWFGNPLQVAATDDTTFAYELGNTSGSEAQQVGGNMSFAPIVDIDINFKNPITNTRTFGSNMERVLEMSEAQIKGFNNNNIIPVAKHFPGDGVDERDQHLLISVNNLEVDDWMNSYGNIYKKLINDGIPSIMVGHIMQPAWERKLVPSIEDKDLRPASSSELLIKGLLRTELDFNGLTITDATPMVGYNMTMARKDLLPATINAGIDMILFNKNIDEDYRYIFEAIETGVLSQERLDEAVTRILGTKLAQGITNIEEQFVKDIPTELSLDATNHLGIVEKLAKQSVTLVKDRDNILPMTPAKYPRIRLVVLGDSDDGGFKQGGKVTDSFVENLQKNGFEVTLYNRTQLDFHEIFEEGVSDLEEKFDLALYVANIETASNQTTTRIDWIQLMAADAPWFMKSIPTIFVSTANPYHLFDIPNISTYVNAYTGNLPTIKATIRKLMGQEEFFGINPVDPFCGDFTTHL
ncbi:glycoside hydrolase family 3 protein [Vagococcus fluvialis]|uniref:glycoside hydrolase family 3 protein n=1 Tax=Vagococcus fluvialis TaxID=2738 RepID=UPI003D0C258D